MKHEKNILMVHMSLHPFLPFNSGVIRLERITTWERFEGKRPLKTASLPIQNGCQLFQTVELTAAGVLCRNNIIKYYWAFRGPIIMTSENVSDKYSIFYEIMLGMF